MDGLSSPALSGGGSDLQCAVCRRLTSSFSCLGSRMWGMMASRSCWNTLQMEIGDWKNDRENPHGSDPCLKQSERNLLGSGSSEHARMSAFGSASLVKGILRYFLHIPKSQQVKGCSLCGMSCIAQSSADHVCLMPRGLDLQLQVLGQQAQLLLVSPHVAQLSLSSLLRW